MKTAISIPDDVFLAAEDHARREGLSRSDLYARALRMYLARIDQAEVTRRLNEVYDSESSDLDPVLKAHQARIVGADEW